MGEVILTIKESDDNKYDYVVKSDNATIRVKKEVSIEWVLKWIEYEKKRLSKWEK